MFMHIAYIIYGFEHIWMRILMHLIKFRDLDLSIGGIQSIF